MRKNAKLKDFVGEFIHELKITNYFRKNRRSYFEYICSCGAIGRVRCDNVRNGETKSCGCHKVKTVKDRTTKHGLSNHPLRDTYKNMMDRCTNPNNDSYRYYGLIGVSVCNGWSDKKDGMRNFIDWAIENNWEKGLQICRIGDIGNYEPNNCRIQTSRENNIEKTGLQSNNKSGYTGIFYNGYTWTSSLYRLGEYVFKSREKTKEMAVEVRNNYIIENNLQHEYDIQEFVK